MPTPADWKPYSWSGKPVAQRVSWGDNLALSGALSKLRVLPPLVTPQEITALKQSLRDVALGRAFVLQGGDCAELFDYCTPERIEAKIKLLLQMSLILIWGAGKPVVRIARIAGQFAKPRSSPTEIVNGQRIPAFRGDNVNAFEATEEAREPDPERLVTAYLYSAATLNYIRASLSSGIADLHSPFDWELGHVVDPEIKAKYDSIALQVTDALRFMNTVGVNKIRDLETADIYTSHEGLMLEYEQALTREFNNKALAEAYFENPIGEQIAPGYYGTSGHFLWIGDRTRQLTGAHVEFFRGIENPIGIKIGPTMDGPELLRILDVVNPTREIGKVTLITRYGASKVADYLPNHIQIVQVSGHLPIWQCDPMHGNTKTTPSGVKTREFSDILSELRQSLEIHRANGSFMGGVHLELTGEAVTECVGGAGGLTEEGLSENYESFCDPRLNEKQALELAFLVAGFYREGMQ